MSKEKKENITKMGRPAKDVIPQTLMAKRLWLLCGGNTFEEISQILDVTSKTARSYLEGKTEPTISQLIKIAQWKRVPLDWIISPPHDMPPTDNREEGKSERTICPTVLGVSNALSRGGKMFYKTADLTAVKYGAFDVVGNDMAPCAMDGQRVMVDTTARPEDGGYAVCLLTIDDAPQCLLRRAIYINDELIRLEVINPASTVPPVTIPKNKVFLMRIVGVLF